MTITLTNPSGRMKTFTLPHESYCKARGRCACAMASSRAPRRVPASLTLAAGARLEGVDEAVLAVPEVDRALRAGELRVERRPVTACRQGATTPPDLVGPAPDNLPAGRQDRRAGKRTRGDA